MSVAPDRNYAPNVKHLHKLSEKRHRQVSFSGRMASIGKWVVRLVRVKWEYVPQNHRGPDFRKHLPDDGWPSAPRRWVPAWRASARYLRITFRSDQDALRQLAEHRFAGHLDNLNPSQPKLYPLSAQGRHEGRLRDFAGAIGLHWIGHDPCSSLYRD